MAWAKKDEQDWDPSTYKEERTWFSGYPDSQDRWVADFKPCYDLVAVYEIDERQSLYRFQLDSRYKTELAPWMSKFYNVVIRHADKPKE